MYMYMHMYLHTLSSVSINPSPPTLTPPIEGLVHRAARAEGGGGGEARRQASMHQCQQGGTSEGPVRSRREVEPDTLGGEGGREREGERERER